MAWQMRMPARSKYRAVRQTVDGINFASQAEARRYRELKLLEKAGEIHELKLQYRMPLLVPTRFAAGTHQIQKIGDYVADFMYCTCCETKCYGREAVIEDVKGFKTPMYRWKKRHVEVQYGVTIKEIS